MKVSRAKAEENRQRVIDTASRLLREHGFDGIGVNALMQAAGLTHGGFYKQFKSKNDLMAQATAAALRGGRSRLSGVVMASEAKPFEALVRSYLSETHRDAAAEGCVFAALGADVARRGPEIRRVVGQGFEEQLDFFEGLVTPAPGQPRRDKAIAAIATMVGALVLSRAVEGSPLSGEILEAAARDLLGEPCACLSKAI